MRIHVGEQLGDPPGGHVGPQRPRRVGIAHTPCQVGHVLQQVRLVDEPILWLDLVAVEADGGAAECLQLQTGGGDDDVGVEVLSGLQRDARRVDMIDVAGDDLSAAVADRGEQVGVGVQAYPLVPRVIARMEVDIDRVAGGQVGDCLAADHPLGDRWQLSAQEPDVPLHDRVLDPRELVRSLLRQHFPGGFCYPTDPRTRADVGRRALQHGDFAGGAGQCRHEGDRGGAAADHHDVLAGVVEGFGPRLRVHERALELLDARKFGSVALVVVVVAAAEEHEPGAIHLPAAVVIDMDRPGVGGRVPVRGAYVAAEPDAPVDAMLVCGRLEVFADVATVGHALFPGPRRPREAQREDAAVTANTGVSEQVPGAADLAATLQDDVAQAGVALGDAVGGSDPGDTCADDDDVEEPGGGAGRVVPGGRRGHRLTA